MRRVERLGYDVLWYPESRGFESLSVAGFMLANTTNLKLGSSIASIYARDAFTSRRGMLSLHALYGDRFILGLGVSHVPMVEGMRGHHYEKPVPAMRAYLDGICKGEAGSENWPIAIAALGPLMLKLAASHTRGALPYNTNSAAHRGSGEDPRPWQVAGDRTEGDAGDRSREGAGAGAQGTRALHDARQLPQQLPAHRLHRSGSGEWRFRPVHRRDGAVGRRRQGEAGPARAFRRGRDACRIQPVHADGDTAARDAILTELANT